MSGVRSRFGYRYENVKSYRHPDNDQFRVVYTDAGERVPPELFARILGCIVKHDGDPPPSNHFVPFGEDELSKCALVCKYWANICQAILFASVKITSRDMLDRLLILLEHPSTRLSAYIQHLDIPSYYVYDTAKSYCRPSWLHLLPMLYAKLPVLRGYGVHIGQQQLKMSGSLQTCRSVHWNLPRACRAFAAHLSGLSLSFMHFRSFADLLRLLDELPDLEALECRYLTWASGPNNLANLPQRRMLKHLGSLDMNGCPPDEYTYHLLLRYRMSPEEGELEQPVLNALLEQTRRTQTLWPGLNIGGSRYPLCLAGEDPPHYFFLSHSSQNGAAPTSIYSYRRTLSAETDRGRTQEVHIYGVCVYFDKLSRISEDAPMTEDDWVKTTLYDHLLSIPTAHIVAFAFRSTDTLSHFETQLSDILKDGANNVTVKYLVCVSAPDSLIEKHLFLDVTDKKESPKLSSDFKDGREQGWPIYDFIK